MESYVAAIADAGFQTVRLPVTWSAHAGVDAPYAVDPAFLERVDEVVGWILDHGLQAIVDFHHDDEMATEPAARVERWLGIWRQLAEHYRDAPEAVSFELLNEPNGELGDALLTLELRGPAGTLPLVVTEAEAIDASFDLVRAWADANGRPPVYVGEFGAYGTADLASRVRWTRAVREAAEDRGFGWAYWEFGATCAPSAQSRRCTWPVDRRRHARARRRCPERVVVGRRDVTRGIAPGSRRWHRAYGVDMAG